MALVVTVTKKSVSFLYPGKYCVFFNMVLTDNSIEVINKDYYAKYRVGDSIASKVSFLTLLMQADIDKYKAEQAIYTNAAMNTVATNTQAGLVV